MERPRFLHRDCKASREEAADERFRAWALSVYWGEAMWEVIGQSPALRVSTGPHRATSPAQLMNGEPPKPLYHSVPAMPIVAALLPSLPLSQCDSPLASGQRLPVLQYGRYAGGYAMQLENRTWGCGQHAPPRWRPHKVAPE